MFKFAHTADNHIGLNRFRKSNQNGNNWRGEDFLDSFKYTMEKIDSENYDFIIIAGDLFENISIDQRYIYEVQKVLKEMKKGTMVYISSGNHDEPKAKSQINPICLLNVLDNVKIINQKEEVIIKNSEGETLKLHFIPWIPDYSEFQKNLLDSSPDPDYKYNIAITHGGVPIGEYKYSKDLIPNEFLEKNFDYIALGDYHNFKAVNDRAYYPGSTDIFRKSEICDKFYLDIELSEKLKVNKVKIKNRECSHYKIDCKGLEKEDILAEVSKYNNSDALIYLDLIDINPFIRDTFKNKDIKAALSNVFYVDITKNFLEEEKKKDKCKDEKIKGIIQEWINFEKEEEIRLLGLEYLSKSVEEVASED